MIQAKKITSLGLKEKRLVEKKERENDSRVKFDSILKDKISNFVNKSLKNLNY